jgi:hypothetical protein
LIRFGSVVSDKKNPAPFESSKTMHGNSDFIIISEGNCHIRNFKLQKIIEKNPQSAKALTSAYMLMMGSYFGEEQVFKQ